MAEEGNGGRSVTALTSSASTRSRASVTGTGSGSSGVTAARTRARASEIEIKPSGMGDILAGMQPASPRGRSARPVPEAPIEALVGDSERLAKGWLIAAIEQAPFSEGRALASASWAAEAPRLCAATARALGSDEALSLLGRCDGPLDALRAVLWSALRAAWPTAEPDQIWDLGERLATVVERLRAAEPSWPRALEDAVQTQERLTVVLAELVDYDRLLAIESPEDCSTVVSGFRRAVREAAGSGGRVTTDGEARAWVIAAGAGRREAEAVKARIAEAVAQ